MSSTLITRPVHRLIALILVCVTLAGCQASSGATASTGMGTSVAASATPAPPLESAGPEAQRQAQTDTVATGPSAETIATTEVAGPTAEHVAPPSIELATLESLTSTTLRARDPVELAYQFGRTSAMQRVVRPTPLDVKVGDKQRFNLDDLGAPADAPGSSRVITATLVLALDHVLTYVEDGLEVDLKAIERSTRKFNDAIYPRNRHLFGSEWTPGIDGDPRITILNASFGGAAGYFDASDQVPKSVNRFSNEREMFYINVDALEPGTESYASTLAHEFQHMIMTHEAQRSATWLNEGLAQLAEELNGFLGDPPGGAFVYLANPDLQLTDWGATPTASSGHYGASYLFLSYFYEHYAQPADLRRMTKEGAGDRLQLFAEIARRKNSAIEDFGDLYADWSAANLLNDRRVGDSRYAYKQLAEVVQPQTLDRAVSDTVAQFGSDYWELPPSRDKRVITFDGSDTIGAVAARPVGNAFWWSNRGDNMDSRLERRFDLRRVESATLQFRLWHDIEDGWDYGFVAVSSDGGERWTTLPGRYTTTDDPQGANFGHGYTGMSGVRQAVGAADLKGLAPSWVEEQIDLTPYAGQEILLRFSVITDQGTNRPGMVLDDIRIPEIGFDDSAETGDAGWHADGFVRTDNELPQQWEVRVVRTAGRRVTVEPLTVDANQVGEFPIAPNEKATVIVMGTTPHTSERASYQLRLMQP